MSEASYDVVICGGGLVGTSLALSLAHLPLTIALVDPAPKAPRRHPDDRTFTLAQGSKRALAKLGVWARLAPASTHALTEIEVSDRAGHFGLTHLRADELGVEALGYVTENRALLAALYATLKTTGVQLIAGRFAGMSETPGADASRIALEGADGPLAVRARLLVGADGTHSAVRAALGLGVRQRDYGREALVTNVTVSSPRPHTAFERFSPQGPVAALPLADGRYTFVVSRRDAKTWEEWPEARFCEALEGLFGRRLGHLTACGRRLRFPLILQIATRARGARTVLVGNAAHTLHPVAGQGFNLGLRDVAHLADGIAAAVRAGGDIGGEAVLAAYEAQRQRDVRNTVGFTDGLVRVFGNDFGPLVIARNLALTAVDCLPSLKRALALRTMGLKRPLPRLLKGLAP